MPLSLPSQGTQNALLILIFNSTPVYDRIFDYCRGTITPACLARVLPAAANAFEEYITRSWHMRLLRYFPDPWGARSMQAQTGCLVSGSLPIQTILGCDYDTDVDLYPWPGTEGPVGSYLGEQGFTLALQGEPGASFDSVMTKARLLGWQFYAPGPSDNGRAGGYRGCREVAAVLPFVKDVDIDGVVTRLQVHLVVSKHSPVATILGFHSTLVINFMTWDRLYCLFPRTNFEERAMVTLRPDKHMESAAVYKYILRGFTELSTFPTDMRPKDLRSDTTESERAMTRWVGDRYTWTVSLSTTDVVPPSTPHVDVTLYGFTLQQMSPAPCAEPPDSDRDSPVVERMIPGHIRVLVDMIDAVPWGEPTSAPADLIGRLSVTYTAPHDFSHTLHALDDSSHCRACRRYFFDRGEETGRDGAMRMAKLAYERCRAGRFGPLPMRVRHIEHVIAGED